MVIEVDRGERGCRAGIVNHPGDQLEVDEMIRAIKAG
jgi:hypothetical protein